jgi:hypothetical protein
MASLRAQIDQLPRQFWEGLVSCLNGDDDQGHIIVLVGLAPEIIHFLLDDVEHLMPGGGVELTDEMSQLFKSK